MNQLLLKKLSVSKSVGELKAPYTGITFDSRQVKPGDIFVAIAGRQSDGHRFISTAIEKGAIAIVCQVLPESLNSNVVYYQVENSSKALGLIAADFYGHPSSKIKLVGVTGTNGKTTSTTLLYQLFSKLGFKVGLLSTIENRIIEKVLATTHTTPNAVAIQSLLAQMVEAGCDYAFMEVSSHAIDQNRISGLQFAGAVFTNLSHDHLDYHKDFKEYIHTKKRLFDELPKEAFALSNIDDRNGLLMLQNTRAKIFRYSLRTLTDFKAKIIENSLTGLHLNLNGQMFFSRLIGEFNAYNLLSVYACAILLGIQEEEVLMQLSQVNTAEGRFETIYNKERGIIGIIDYAHTPDALEKVLQTINKLKRGNENVITVVGCGGNRDKAKRPLMADIAARLSNQVVITSDNPRSEKAEDIIADMEKGLSASSEKKVLSISDRKQAIKTACKLANKGDIILVAGKGHEKYQEINGVKYPFDDKQVLKEAL